MYLPASVTGAACLAVFLLAMPVAAQDRADQPAPKPPAIALDSAASLFDSTFELVQAAADAGDSGAALAVARALFAETDPDRQQLGVAYLRAAAEAGSRSAVEQLADLYASGGYGLAPDPKQALSYYEDAVEKGSIDALASLGRLLLNTDFSVEGQKRGRDLLQQASDAGQVSASNTLGSIYLQGRGVPQDIDKGLYYYGIGVTAGSSNSILALGDVLRSGARNFQPDPGVAIELFQLAADKGDAGAARRIADMHLRGEGVAQDAEAAEQMLTALAEGGDAAALIALGDIYRDGEFAPQDGARAAEYYQQAADLGNSSGLTRLANLYLDGAPGVDINVRRGVDFYVAAVDKGSTSAMRGLAELYLDGRAGTADPQQAIDLLKRAASFADSQAAARLAVIYANNDPFPADYDEVQNYLNLALAMGNTDAVIEVASAIASGPLARDHRDQAFELLSNAVESRVSGAAARLARLQLDGSFPAQGVDGVMTMLNDAATGGDTAAARFLLQLYREGSGLLLKPDPAAAEDFLATIEPVLGKEGAAVERIKLLATRNETSEVLEQINANYTTLSLATSLTVLNDLRRNNARAYVYVIQKGLQPLGLYQGTPNGTLDSVTIRALRAACLKAEAERECAPGPLTSGTARVIAALIWQNPA